jgi:hypothetical protein
MEEVTHTASYWETGPNDQNTLEQNAIFKILSQLKQEKKNTYLLTKKTTSNYISNCNILSGIHCFIFKLFIFFCP